MKNIIHILTLSLVINTCHIFTMNTEIIKLCEQEKLINYDTINIQGLKSNTELSLEKSLPHIVVEKITMETGT